MTQHMCRQGMIGLPPFKVTLQNGSAIEAKR